MQGTLTKEECPEQKLIKVGCFVTKGKLYFQYKNNLV